MGNSPLVRPQKSPQSWLVLSLLGFGAIVAGLFLPRLLAEPSPAGGETPPANPSSQSMKYTPPVGIDPPNHQAMFMRLGLGTAGVLVLCVGTMWLCKRWLRGAAPAGSGTGQLRLVETLPLGGRCFLHLVQTAGRNILVGADSGGVKTVVPIPDSFAGTLSEVEERPPMEETPARSVAGQNWH